MKKFIRQIIAQVGLDSCGNKTTLEAFKECVENLKNKSLPVTDNFDNNPPIGCMTNFEFKDGKIFADIDLLDDITSEPAVSCAFEILESVKSNNTIDITKCKLIEGYLIDELNNTDNDLSRKIRGGSKMKMIKFDDYIFNYFNNKYPDEMAIVIQDFDNGKESDK